MPRLWLPISHGGRTRHVLIPYTQNIDESQLDEIIEWQKEKTLDELKKLPPKKPMDEMRSKEVVGMLKEYIAFLKRRRG